MEKMGVGDKWANAQHTYKNNQEHGGRKINRPGPNKKHIPNLLEHSDFTEMVSKARDRTSLIAGSEIFKLETDWGTDSFLPCISLTLQANNFPQDFLSTVSLFS
ncbi:hypothetical protein RND71_026389 [Anisodus tanguticus]|uniref:Uncharacterized protein n=1 Tax=Anisodus tanguticus TaxID=243964 RepID=A0AAE1RMA6_9SOLA|nr:hypothetical protein RND71_026389 [Anisodus tanguticus]